MQPTQASKEGSHILRKWVDRFHAPWAVEALPTLIHLSLFSFAGPLTYLFSINYTVFSAALCWIAPLSAPYGCVMLMPIFRHDSPYYAPLYSTMWFLYTSVLCSVLEIRLRFSARGPLLLALEMQTLCHQRILGGVQEATEKSALELSSEIDVRVLEWTVDALDEDDALEKLYGSMLGLYKFDVVGRGSPTVSFWKRPAEDPEHDC